ncbi:hypothetical protein M885DRAFT_613818, partial [Pelagophyceae sp. CCMP2097]
DGRDARDECLLNCTDRKLEARGPLRSTAARFSARRAPPKAVRPRRSRLGPGGPLEGGRWARGSVNGRRGGRRVVRGRRWPGGAGFVDGAVAAVGPPDDVVGRRGRPPHPRPQRDVGSLDEADRARRRVDGARVRRRDTRLLPRFGADGARLRRAGALRVRATGGAARARAAAALCVFSLPQRRLGFSTNDQARHGIRRQRLCAPQAHRRRRARRAGRPRETPQRKTRRASGLVTHFA